MKSRQIMFFATRDDLSPILEKIENQFDIEYIEMGMFETKEFNRHVSISKLPNFGYTKYSNWISLDNRYMIILKNSELQVRDIPQRRGGLKFAIDPMLNSISIELSTGGIYIEKENVLIAGRIGVTSANSFSEKIYSVFYNSIKEAYKKIGIFYVGKNAEEKLRSGWRLVTSEKSPEEFDLALD